MKQQIKIITNNNNRNEKFIPIFNHLVKQGYGKLEQHYCLCDTKLNINSNVDYQLLFSVINMKCNSEGFSYIMYQI